jgi:hypothetical protein
MGMAFDVGTVAVNFTGGTVPGGLWGVSRER